ncbi:MAG: ABC transporter permease [Chloroflexi bacterium]|nr:ABC transporter permease [Chloroflexota bacterium]MCH8870880.1 ABC transporter permease [Chloroflexota bacterium]MCI0771321.1 ABC transporter permease [Chloroflexota bacterium]MCI0791704.1 ABC transporter permease [Chloroflexota bacterium]MCI0796595.1 ABC transporter permease [Chloroflexota bacterium]
MVLSKLYIFFWRDWVEAKSYKVSFLLSFATMGLPFVLMVFLGRLFDDVSIDALERYGGNYVAFAMVGLLVTSFAGTALNAFASSLRRAQIMGTLEVLISTKTSVPTMMFGWALYPFFRATLSAVSVAIGGFLILGIAFDNVNVVGMLLILVAMVVTMCSLGIMAASFTLVFKQGDPFTRLVTLASGLLSGMLFPVELMPTWLQYVANVLPHTYAIEGMRLALLTGASTSELLPALLVLTLYSVILVPLGFLVFGHSMVRAKKEGSLAHY